MATKEQLKEMQKLYLDAERQFEEVSIIIPIDNEDKVYSPRFYNILQFTCAQVHSLFKFISEDLKLHIERDNFPEYHNVLNSKGMLEAQEIFLRPKKIQLKPFKKESSHEWWTGYNDTKHHLPEGIKQGTLGNVLEALAATFVLNNIANFAKYPHIGEELLDKKNWHNQLVDYGNANLEILLDTTSQNPIKSNFFYSISSYWNEGAPI